jgi:hypothetical protein
VRVIRTILTLGNFIQYGLLPPIQGLAPDRLCAHANRLCGPR